MVAKQAQDRIAVRMFLQEFFQIHDRLLTLTERDARGGDLGVDVGILVIALQRVPKEQRIGIAPLPVREPEAEMRRQIGSRALTAQIGTGTIGITEIDAQQPALELDRQHLVRPAGGNGAVVSLRGLGRAPRAMISTSPRQRLRGVLDRLRQRGRQHGLQALAGSVGWRTRE